MNRRNAIGNIVIFSLGTVVFPSCGRKDEALVKLKNFSITGGEEKMMSQLADTIIPKTTFMGAADVKAHEFTLMMVDDCYEPDKQKQFAAGLKGFDQQAKIKFGSSFTACTAAQKNAFLTSIEKKKDIPDEVVFFYETAKRHTIQAFTSSREYMTDVLKYNMVPGSHFKGCVPVKKTLTKGEGMGGVIKPG